MGILKVNGSVDIQDLLTLKTGTSAYDTPSIDFGTDARIGYGSTKKTLGIYSSNNIYFRPNNGTLGNSDGIELSTTTLIPTKNNTVALGNSTHKWSNVYATTFTGALSGNATSASAAPWSGITGKPTSYPVKQSRSVADSYRPLLLHYVAGEYGVNPDTAEARTYYHENIAACPSTGAIKATTFIGALNGNASTATTLSATLAINKGGTGATTRAVAVDNLFYLGGNLITTNDQDKPSVWKEYGQGFAYFNDDVPNSDAGVNRPTTWMQILNIGPTGHSLRTQLGFTSGGSNIYIRGGSSNDDEFGAWYTVLTTKSTITVAQGGTGITSNPSMLVNLGSTTADTVFEASPRPGVTGTLKVANGGTGATTFTSGYLIQGNGTNALKVTNAHINYTAGTTSTDGCEALVLGNSTKSGTAGNTFGRLTLYSSSSAGIYLTAATTASWITNIVPAVAGTLLNTGNYSSYALPLSGGTMTGDILFTNKGIVVEAGNTDQYIWKVYSSEDGSHGFRLQYNGTGAGDNNILSLFADNQDGTEVEAIEIKQSGAIHLAKNVDCAGTITASSFSGNASSATTLSSTLTVAKGGTGATTAKGAEYNIITNTASSTSAITDTTQFVFKYANPSATNGVLYYRTGDHLWTYIKDKSDSTYLKLTGGTMTGTITSQNITPETSDTYDLGTIQAPWHQIITRRLYLLDGTNTDVNYGRFIVTTQGTTSNQGVATLYVGNTRGAKTAGGAYGQVTIFGEGAGYATLRATASATAASTHYLPTTGGTLLNTETYDSYAVPKAGGTMTGNLTVTNSSSTAVTTRSVTAKNANGEVKLHVATNRGIYDTTGGDWMVYAKKADTLTTRIPNKVVLEDSYGSTTTMNNIASPVTGQVFFVTS